MTLVDTAQIAPHARLLAGKPLTLRYVYVDAEGKPTDAPSTPTVAVTDLAGATVTTEAVTTRSRDNDDRPKVYEAAVLIANAPTAPDLLTVVWSPDTAGTETRYVELVSDFYFDLAEWRRWRDRSGTTSSRKGGGTDDQLAAARMVAEQECERICGRAWVHRARQLRVAAPSRPTSRLVLPDADLVSVASVVTVDGGTTYTAGQLANLQVAGSMIERRDGSVWPDAPDWYTVRYTYGLQHPPAEIKQAVMRRAAYWLKQSDTGVPDWAGSVSPEGSGLTFRVGEDSRTSGMTGDPVVNAIYRRYMRETAAVIA